MSQRDRKGAIYARYSSAMQNPRSIEDQLVLCRRRIPDGAAGAEIDVYVDRAETATSMYERDGLHRLLRDVADGLVGFVLAESLDRISRDLADLAGFYKRLQFHDVELSTVEEGRITPLHVGLKGVMNQEHISSLALKTRRGMEGAVRQGRATGGVAYGYRIANRISPDGQIVRGLREIDVDQAEVVRRIYRWYADGRGVRWISDQLNAEGIPAPGGGLWKTGAINGHAKRRNGILQNELYCGRRVFGRTRSRRDPDTGRRRARFMPPDEWTVVEVPELRIIEEDLWAVAQLRRKASKRSGPGRRTNRPLTGLVRCGMCGGRMTIHQRARYACLTRQETGACAMRRRVAAEDVEQTAAQQLCEHVMWGADWVTALEAAGEAVVAMQAETAREIEEREGRLNNLIEMIELGERGGGVRKRVAELEEEIAAMKLHARALDVLPRKPRPARQLWEQLRERVEELARRAGSEDTETRLDAMTRVRDLIERIDVAPGPQPKSIVITVRPKRSALIVLAIVRDFEVMPSEPILRRLARDAT